MKLCSVHIKSSTKAHHYIYICKCVPMCMVSTHTTHLARLRHIDCKLQYMSVHKQYQYVVHLSNPLWFIRRFNFSLLLFLLPVVYILLFYRGTIFILIIAMHFTHLIFYLKLFWHLHVIIKIELISILIDWTKMHKKR